MRMRLVFTSCATGGLEFTRGLEVASGSVVYAGAMTAINSGGKAVPAASSGAITVVGRGTTFKLDYTVIIR